MKFALVNQSTLVSDEDVQRIARAVDEQLGAAAQAWDLERPTLGSGAPEPDDVQIVILDDSDQAGALGYHDVTPEGAVYASVFARDSIAGLAGVDPASLTGVQPSDLVLRTVASVVSHEALEALGDPQANLWADGPDDLQWAVELCDPVESSSYLIDVDGAAVAVSDFVHPAFFEASTAAGAQVDEMAVLTTGPFTIAPDGYAITRTEGAVHQQYGEELAGWRRSAHDEASLTSRSGWRLLLSQLDAEEAPNDDDEIVADVLDGLEREAVDETEPADLRPVLDPDEEAELERARISHPANPGQPGSALIHQDNVSQPGVEHTKHAGGRSTRHHTADR